MSVYFPHSRYADHHIEKMYKTIEKHMQNDKNCMPIIGGDFNAELGPGSGPECKSVGKHTLNESNKRGDWLKSWLMLNDYSALNTMFRKTPQKQTSFVSPKGKEKQIDYILTKRRYLRNVKDAEANDMIHMGSDHRCVMATFLIDMPERRINDKRGNKKCETSVTAEREDEAKEINGEKSELEKRYQEIIVKIKKAAAKKRKEAQDTRTGEENTAAAAGAESTLVEDTKREHESKSTRHSSMDDSSSNKAAASEVGRATVETATRVFESESRKRSSKDESRSNTAAAPEAGRTTADAAVNEYVGENKKYGSDGERASEAESMTKRAHPRGVSALLELRRPDGWTSTPRGKDDDKKDTKTFAMNGEEGAQDGNEPVGCSSSCDLRAGERLPKKRPLAPHLHMQKFLQVVEAGSIVLQARNESSGSRGKDKRKQGTTQNAAAKNDESVDRDDEIVRLIEERRKLPKEEKHRLKELSKKIKKCIREKKRMKRQHDIERILEEFKGIRNITRVKSAKKRIFITRIRNTRGESITSRKGIADTFGEFYKKLYEDIEKSNFEYDESDEERIPEITSGEIQAAICKLKSGKSPDGNGIRAEDIKDCSEETREMMRQVFNEVIKRNNFTPEEWKKVKIKVIHKKGDVEDVSNYRPICSLPSMYKLFSTIMFGRLYPMLDLHQAEDQAGFRKTYQTTDHLATYRLICQKCQEWGIKMWTATVDFKKAFDSISHRSIWDALKSCNVNNGYIRLLMKIYRDQKASVMTDEESNIFDIQKGSKQGDPLSSLLFNTVLQYSLKDEIQRWQKRKGMGIYLSDQDRDCLTNLRFADDVMLFATSKRQIQAMMCEFKEATKKVGLTIHPNKTKILSSESSMNQDTKKYMKVGDLDIEILTKRESVKYLGQRICFHDQETMEIKSRIRAAWATFHKYRQELTSKKYLLKYRLRLFDATVSPTLCYAAGTWSPSREHERMIQSTQRKMLRLIIQTKRKYKKIERKKGIDHMIEEENEDRTDNCSTDDKSGDDLSTNSEDDVDSGATFEEDSEKDIDTAEIEEEDWFDYMRRSTAEAVDKMDQNKIRCWNKTHKKMKWKLALRIATSPSERWVKKAAEWNPETSSKYMTSRPIGRPKKRWEDDINVFLKQIYDETKMEETRDNKISWISAAKDRKVWTRLEEKYTSQKTK